MFEVLALSVRGVHEMNAHSACSVITHISIENHGADFNEIWNGHYATPN